MRTGFTTRSVSKGSWHTHARAHARFVMVKSNVQVSRSDGAEGVSRGARGVDHLHG